MTGIKAGTLRRHFALTAIVTIAINVNYSGLQLAQ